MPHGSISVVLPAPREAAFQLVHDYSRRLEWDTLLRDARLCPGWTKAQLGARSICTGRWMLGGLALETEYVQFKPPEVAAVRLVNPPPFFATFAATIRHRDLGDGTSSAEYVYTFTARPAWLRWLLHPLMGAAFRWETRRRLFALRGYLRTTKRRDDAL